MPRPARQNETCVMTSLLSCLSMRPVHLQGAFLLRVRSSPLSDLQLCSDSVNIASCFSNFCICLFSFFAISSYCSAMNWTPLHLSVESWASCVSNFVPLLLLCVLQ